MSFQRLYCRVAITDTEVNKVVKRSSLSPSLYTAAGDIGGIGGMKT